MRMRIAYQGIIEGRQHISWGFPIMPPADISHLGEVWEQGQFPKRDSGSFSMDNEELPKTRSLMAQ